MSFKYNSISFVEMHVEHIEGVREMLWEHVSFLFRKLCLAQQKIGINPVFAIIIKLIIMVLKWVFCTQVLWFQFSMSNNLNQYLKRTFRIGEPPIFIFTGIYFCALTYILSPKLNLICKTEYLNK